LCCRHREEPKLFIVLGDAAILSLFAFMDCFATLAKTSNWSIMKSLKNTPTLFASISHAPLAERLRAKNFSEVVGQDHLFGESGVLSRMIEARQFASLILWGPPGCGKTTLARLIAAQSGYQLETLSAVASGVADLKKIFETAAARLKDGKRTLLFVDEIHRFNRAQQDAFLPYVEDGTIILIGATTENPSFELNAALLSRCRVLILKRLDEAAMLGLLAKAEAMQGRVMPLTGDAKQALCAMADGDGRYFLNMVEELFSFASIPASLKKIDPAGTQPDMTGSPIKSGMVESWNSEALVNFLQQRPAVYDKAQESHYNLISALHKSLRGSDVQAGLYWLARMLAGGENPLYIVRRLVRFAVEDIGMADPEALHQTLAAKDAYDFLGSPEGELAIAQAVIYLATAPKSNAAYVAFKASQKSAAQYGSLMPPAHILNAPTKLMKEIGYGKGYAYDHDTKDGFSGQNYFPDDMKRQEYYSPKEAGFEREIKKRLEYWEKLREVKK
jgi:putative ATPase